MHRHSPATALVAYFAFLAPLTAVLSSLWIANPAQQLWVYAIMLAPAISALLAWAVSGVRPRFGRFGWRSIGFGLGLVALASTGYIAAAAAGAITAHGPGIPWIPAVLNLIPSIGIALGEELGWRGYLLPQLRRVLGFWGANAIVGATWFLYHLPLILWGPYAPTDRPVGIAVLFFAINVVLISFTIGALWELTHDVWMPAIAHGAWNVFIADVIPAGFAGSPAWLLGEFGFLPTIPLVVALVVALLLSRRHRPQRLDLTETRRRSTARA